MKKLLNCTTALAFCLGVSGCGDDLADEQLGVLMTAVAVGALIVDQADN